jgi:UDP-glucose 4-epimerase
MKILVIGSKGFIGSHVYKYFSEKSDYSCWGCDVVVDYTDDHYILVDHITSDFNEVFEKNQFDICINCAGAASVPDSIKNPFRDFSLNVHHVAMVLEAIRKHGNDCRFINMSSAAVYGNPEKLPISENASCSPLSPYGKHKLFAEEICKEYHEYFGIKTCSLRIFSAYGPGLRKQILWDIYQKSLQANTVNLFGTGSETRDFIFIDDIVDAIHKVILAGDFNAGIYNIGSGQEMTIRELADTLLEEMQYRGRLIFSGNERKGDPINWKANISRIRTLNFEPKSSIKAGTKLYVRWLREEKLL